MHRLSMAVSSIKNSLRRTEGNKHGKKKRNWGKEGKSRDPADGRDALRTAAGVATSTLSHPAVAAGDPLAVAIAAQIAPFNAPRGLAKKLTDTKPSQSVSARGQTTFSIPSGSTALFWCTPAACSNNTNVSMAIVVCPGASLGAATSTITSTSVGSFPAGCQQYSVVTTTPYDGATLCGGDYTARLVGAGVRIRNVSEALYRGGLLRYVCDDQDTALAGLSADTTTYATWMGTVDSHQGSVRKHFSDNSVVEILYPSSRSGWLSSIPVAYSAFFDQGNTPFATSTTASNNNVISSARFGGTTNIGCLGNAPKLFGYFTNGSSGAQTIDVEIVEHWEYHGSGIVSLHTPGVPHVSSQSLLDGLSAHLATQHATNPHLHFKDIVKQGVKLAHNKAAVRDAEMVASVALAL